MVDGRDDCTKVPGVKRQTIPLCLCGCAYWVHDDQGNCRACDCEKFASSPEWELQIRDDDCLALLIKYKHMRRDGTVNLLQLVVECPACDRRYRPFMLQATRQTDEWTERVVATGRWGAAMFETSCPECKLVVNLYPYNTSKVRGVRIHRQDLVVSSSDIPSRFHRWGRPALYDGRPLLTLYQATWE